MTNTRPRLLHLLDGAELRVNPEGEGLRTEYLPEGLSLSNWFDRDATGHDLAEHMFLRARIDAAGARGLGTPPPMVLIEVVHPRALQEFWREISHQFPDIDGLCMIVDEEGLLHGLRINSPASVLYGYGIHPDVQTPICGPAYILAEKRIYDEEGYLEDTAIVGLPAELTEEDFRQLFLSILIASTTSQNITTNPAVLMED